MSDFREAVERAWEDALLTDEERRERNHRAIVRMIMEAFDPGEDL